MRLAWLAAIGILAALIAAGTPARLECGSCHREQARAQPATGMAHALASGGKSAILSAHVKLTFQQGPYSYTIERTGDQSLYRVTDGKEEFSAPISWAFGLGAAGQTYLLNRGGAWYESRVSYYQDTDNLDLTVGARPSVPRDLEEAIGRELSAKGAEECFNCHATGALAEGKLRVENLTAGIQCGRCHEQAEAHLAGFERASAPKVLPRKLGAMTSEEVADYCGQCHRTWSTIAAQGPHNITNVRFQPYRLVNSKCYDAADARIRCTSCHDPHQDGAQPVANYDRRCKSCHSAGGKAEAKLCKAGTKECAGCHMPKVEIKEAHNRFTDHWIRIALPGTPAPN